MRALLISTGLFLLFFIQSNSIDAQAILKGELKEGVTLADQINPGEKHRYVVKVNRNQFVFIKLMQKNVDVILTAYDVDGTQIEEVDGSDENNGPEILTFNSHKTGDYMIEVRHFNQQDPKGNYSIKVENIERTASTLNGRVDQLLTPWNSKGSPGVAVGIIKDGEVKYKNAYGSGNLEYDIPISTSTVFHLASVSKQVTAFAILLLVKEGKLSLDDEVGKYVPDFPNFVKKITIKHLLNHTSGLRDHYNLLLTAGYRFDDVITREQILKLISRQKDLNHEPGEEFVYNNTGYILLAEIVTKISGESFKDFTRKNIFEPLKMKNTFFNDDHERVIKNFAYSYSNYGCDYKKRIMSFSFTGSTSLLSTIDDFSKWVQNFESPTVGDSSIIRQMNERGILNNGDTIKYALGQFVQKYKGLKTICHNGSDAGYSTYVGRFPDQKFSVIVFSNLASIFTTTLASHIADIYLEKDIHEDLMKISLDIEYLKKCCGKYKINEDSIFDITLEDDKLFLNVYQQKIPLVQSISQGEFKIIGTDNKFIFNVSPGVELDNVKIILNNKHKIANRIKTSESTILNTLTPEYTGRYYSEELCSFFNLVIENNKLIAKHSRMNDIELNAISKDGFIGNNWILEHVEFVRDKNFAITGLKVSNGRAKNIWFNKIEQFQYKPN